MSKPKWIVMISIPASSIYHRCFYTVHTANEQTKKDSGSLCYSSGTKMNLMDLRM